MKQHPRHDDAGKSVILSQPSVATPLTAWEDRDALATVLPEGPVPPGLNGIPFTRWDAPRTEAAWQSVPGTGTFLEPPVPETCLHLTAGVVILESDGRVWTVSPSNAFGGYRNTFPKGHPDHGLGLRITAIKEAFEESGLQVELRGWLVDALRTTSVARYYLARRVGGTPADMGWESQAVNLVPISSLAGHCSHPKDQKILAALSGHLKHMKLTAAQ